VKTTTISEQAPLQSGEQRQAGFSLIEILVAVSLLTIIILGLLAMFGQVQKAFKGSITQTDVLEGGRAGIDLLARELEEIAPCGRNAVNFFAEIPAAEPLLQGLPGSGNKRTNVMEDMFFLTRQNQTWTGIGYFVRTNDAVGNLWLPEPNPGKMGAGTLYRFATNTTSTAQDPRELFLAFDKARKPGAFGSFGSSNVVQRIADGVVHFKFDAYYTNGVQITNDFNLRALNSDIRLSSFVPGEVGLYKFFSNAVPAAVEMELGMLEQQTWGRYKSIAGGDAQRKYLSNHVGQVHVFRQRVPVRNVDFKAYQ
jgi:prepilin-type N-terminal cleavage/methylation domain-containing protein